MGKELIPFSKNIFNPIIYLKTINAMKKIPLFIALDVENKAKALDLIQKTKDYVQGYKIGPRLFLTEGSDLILEIKSHGAQVFLDFKFFDIPSSTLSAVQSAFDLGSDFVTVHASVGKEALQLLSQFEKSARQKRDFRILFVTVLSSFSNSPEHTAKVLELADSVYKAGLRALVCSPWELKALREKYKDMFFVTPGIRLKGDSLDDQKRVMTPDQALQEGSSALVMGRSFIRAEDPEKILEGIYSSIRS